MTLRDIISTNRELFYRQEWYWGESFLDREADVISTLPRFEQWSFPYLFPKQDGQRVSAATLALLYVNNPTAELFDKFLWTDDLDHNGDRVYFGGKSNTGKAEIHRHLTVTSRYGLPSWV